MASALLQFGLAAAVIVVAGTLLTRFADAIAELTRWGRLLVGSVFLAAATSLPELSIDVSAVRGGHPDLAVGDLLGSSLFNLLILGLLDMSHRSGGRMLSRVSAAHALSATMSIALTAIAGIAIISGSRLHVAGIGVGSLAILIVYLLGIRLVYYNQQYVAKTDPTASETASSSRLTLRTAIIGYLLTATVIVASGPFVADSAGRLAELTGWGGTFVGTTLVAFSTSLPELVTTMAAVRMSRFDLALGNIFGSNSFNMVLLLVLDAAYPEPLLASVSLTHALTSLSTILVTCVAVMGQLYHVERRIHFIEPDALLVITLVLGSLTMLYFLKP